MDPKLTEKIKGRYNRISGVFNMMEKMGDMASEDWRAKAFGQLYGKVLEVGCGTGINFPFYPAGVEVTAIDFSPKMLAYAQKNLLKTKVPISLVEMDAQKMSFADNSFDCVIDTCVFCSVPDPIKGLQEIKRVCKPGGTIVMIEHVRSDNPVLGKIMDFLNPVVVNVVGANINRETLKNVENAGIKVTSVDSRIGKILKLIIATP